MLSEYLQVIWRRKGVILVITLITLAISVAGSTMLPNTYSATSVVRILTTTGGGVDWVQYDTTYADRLMNTYAKIVTSGPVVDELKSQFDLEVAPEIEVSIIANTELLEITVIDENEQLAIDSANLLGELLVLRGRELYENETQTALASLDTQVTVAFNELSEARSRLESLEAEVPPRLAAIETARRMTFLREDIYTSLLAQYERNRVMEAMQNGAISVVDPAIIAEPSGNLMRILLGVMGLIVGLVGGLGVAFMTENLDTRIYNPSDIESMTQLMTLARIPRMSKKDAGLLKPEHPYTEAFRRLRTNLFAVDVDNPPQKLLVTSAETGEGKSTIIANLAASIAQTGREVVIIDGDMRRPALHSLFNLPNDTGLSDYLSDEGEKPSLGDRLQDTHDPRLKLLSSGPIPSNPAELIGSERMQALLDELATQFDVILLDAPAMLAVTDAVVAASYVDSVVFVVRQGEIRRGTIDAMNHQLRFIKSQVHGLVVNRAADSEKSYHYYAMTSKND